MQHILSFKNREIVATTEVSNTEMIIGTAFRAPSININFNHSMDE